MDLAALSSELRALHALIARNIGHSPEEAERAPRSVVPARSATGVVDGGPAPFDPRIAGAPSIVRAESAAGEGDAPLLTDPTEERPSGPTLAGLRAPAAVSRFPLLPFATARDMPPADMAPQPRPGESDAMPATTPDEASAMPGSRPVFGAATPTGKQSGERVPARADAAVPGSPANLASPAAIPRASSLVAAQAASDLAPGWNASGRRAEEQPTPQAEPVFPMQRERVAAATIIAPGEIRSSATGAMERTAPSGPLDASIVDAFERPVVAAVRTATLAGEDRALGGPSSSPPPERAETNLGGLPLLSANRTSAPAGAGVLATATLLGAVLDRLALDPIAGRPGETEQMERAGVIASFILNAAMIPGWPPPRPIEPASVAGPEFARRLAKADTKEDEQLLLLLLRMQMRDPEKIRRLFEAIAPARRRSKLLAFLAVLVTGVRTVMEEMVRELEALAQDRAEDAQASKGRRVLLR